MLYFDRIDISDIDVNQTTASKKYDICHYWYFAEKGFKFHLNVCNGFYDALMMSKNLSNIVILKIRCDDYHCIISGTGKNEVVNLLQNVTLIEKTGILQNKIFVQQV